MNVNVRLGSSVYRQSWSKLTTLVQLSAELRFDSSTTRQTLSRETDL